MKLNSIKTTVQREALNEIDIGCRIRLLLAPRVGN